MPDTQFENHNRELRPDGSGRLKIFLGFGPGVGKTFAMLDESMRRKKRGAVILVGAVDPKKRAAIEEIQQNFEIIPMIEVKGGSTMNLAEIIARNPDVVIIDGLSKSNPAGATNSKRYEDVLEILKAGICVLTTLDVQDLDSLNDVVADQVGMRPTETLPDWVFQGADEVEMVDLTPRALVHRIERGDVFPAEELGTPKTAWITEHNISFLREMALREIAGRVDVDVETFRKGEHHTERPFATQDRVMICLSPTRPSNRVIRRGWRIAHRMRADAIAVYVDEDPLDDREAKIIEADIALADRLDIPNVKLKGNVAPELIRYAKQFAVTHIVIGHTDRTKFQELTKGSIINALTKELKTVDIIVVANEVE